MESTDEMMVWEYSFSADSQASSPIPSSKDRVQKGAQQMHRQGPHLPSLCNLRSSKNELLKPEVKRLVSLTWILLLVELVEVLAEAMLSP